MDNPSLVSRKSRAFWSFLAALFAIMYFAGSALTPFIIALILAYILDPLVDRLEATGLPRTAAILFFICCLILVVILGVLILFPIIKLQIEHVAKNLPTYVQAVQELILPWITMLSSDPEKIRTLSQDTFLKLGNLPVKALGSVASFFWSALSGFMNFTVAMVNLVIIPVATFYLLRDIDRIKEKAVNLIPLDQRERVFSIAEKLHRVLGNFVRGQLTVVCILSVIYCVGLFLVGLPLSLPIGILAGLANIVPYLGLILGLVPSLVLSYLHFHDIIHLLFVCLVFGVAQALEGMVITPKVVGEKLGLHPVVIMLAVFLGGQLFGFSGVLMAVPVAAAINVFWTEGLETYKKSELYLGARQVEEDNENRERKI